MSRTGKIARLPKEIREQLNHRLEDGETGGELASWLNGLPECQEMLAEKFGGRPINEGNISEWRLGGYEDWQRGGAARERLQGLLERAETLDDVADGDEIGDRLGTLVAAELADAIAKLEEITDANERWRRLQEISRELSRLRREDHHGRRLCIAQERGENELEDKSEEEEKAAKKEQKEKLLGIFHGVQGIGPMEQILGGGEYGKKWAEWLYPVENDLQMPEWWTEKEAKNLRGGGDPMGVNPTKSEQIPPNGSKSDQKRK